MADLMGYAHPSYVLSLQEFGEPFELANSGGWILVRDIPATPYKDAMGCYPLFTCQDWFRLQDDLKIIESELLSLALVTDPFGAFDPAYLSKCFQIVKLFKKHLIADLNKNIEEFISKHHRNYARKSLEHIKVEISHEPARYIDDWVKLYGNLIKRHNIHGIRAFSKESFRTQMKIPGVILSIAKLRETIIGGLMTVVINDIAYAHLAAFSEEAYKYYASFGIYWMTLIYLKEHNFRLFDLGAGPGIYQNARGGLQRFKEGWSNGSRTVYFCGKIFDKEKYMAICERNNIGITDYFPGYRKGEFK